MEKWLTVNEYMDTFFNFLMAVGALGSLIFVGLGYSLAKGEIEKHKVKSKLDSNDKYAKLIYENLAELNLQLKYILDRRQNFEDQKELERIHLEHDRFKGNVYKSGLNLKFILPIFRSNRKELESNIIFTNVQTYARLIKDEKCLNLIEDFMDSYDAIFNDFKDKLKSTKPEMVLELKSAAKIENTKMFEFSKELIKGIDDNHELMNNYHVKMDNIFKHLDIYIV